MASSADDDAKRDREALLQKSLAESKFKTSNLKSALKHAKKAYRLSPNINGLSSMLTAFEILRVSKPAVGDSPDWYKILQVEPFSQINTIRKQYRKLALVLHPDKNPSPGCEDAFKLVNEGFRIFSDRIRRKEYDMKLRIKIQGERVSELADDEGEPETFWTACSRCSLLHKFERKYVGHNLVCPGCKKSFEAVEVGSEYVGRDEEESSVRLSDRVKKKRVSVESPTQVSSELNADSMGNMEDGEETLTLAQLRSKLKHKTDNRRRIPKTKTKTLDEGGEDGVADGLENLRIKTSDEITSNAGMEKYEAPNEKKDLKVYSRRSRTKVMSSEILSIGPRKKSRSSEMAIKAVEDSKYYDFANERTERSFKRGQVWAVYDDDDGMPRHYCLINNIVSLNPFMVEISWLDQRFEGGVKLIPWEKTGMNVPWGRFNVSNKNTVSFRNIFSHRVNCERAAKDIYRIFPTKGSVWAVYTTSVPAELEKRQYNIVVFLTSYSEMHHGMSMAYLEKVDGYNTAFKRKEIGRHAIHWMGRDDVRLLSHQIPAKKLSGDQLPENFKEWWELDPASLP